MVSINQLINKDLAHVWHPCSQMKSFEKYPPLIIDKAKGSYLYSNKGILIDAISSWWCKPLGHGHPAIISAIEQQLKEFEHVIAANTTHPKLVELAEQLSDITGKQHVFFASDGSSAVEIAMKLAIHSMQVKGQAHKNQFIALKNSYHGETLGAMSISDLELYTKPYQNLGAQCFFIDSVPYLYGMKDPLWTNSDEYWNLIIQQIEPISDKVCAVILEPIVQGAGGMLCYSADFLKKISLWAKSKGIYLIADEIMTGWGRTGQWLACDHAQISPDLICLSKGITAGSIPFSCVMIDHAIFDLFYNDYKTGPSFLHSHTYSGNALAVSAALATIKVMKEENILKQAQHLEGIMLEHLQQVATATGKLINVRGIGGIAAADLIDDREGRIGDQVYQQALNMGALIKPIGTTLYWLPPLNIEEKIIGKLADITLNSINKAYKVIPI